MFIKLTAFDLSLAAVLVVLLGMLSAYMKLGVAKQLYIAALRTTIQLSLIGLVLKSLFESTQPFFILLICFVMISVAGWEILSRQKRKLKGWWGFGVSAGSLFISSFLITVLSLFIVIQADPWYSPQYAVPLFGMLLGNTMTGIALGMDRLTQTAWQQRPVIEQRLMLGESADKAISDIRSEAMRAGMIPIINSMAAAGLVSLPGMMTGQILSGTEPMIAVKYQILIMFLITAGTGFGTWIALWFGSRHMFDERQRLRLDRLRINEND